MAALDLGIVILNWNTRDHLRECLKSVFASAGEFACRVCVVDNASTDGSAEMTLAEFPQAMLVKSPQNGGYAYGNNLGLRALGFEASGVSRQSSGVRHQPSVVSRQSSAVSRQSSVVSRQSSAISNQQSAIPRYALLLNPDTVLPPTALADMLAYMDAHPEAGAAGPKLVLLDGRLDLACRRAFPSPEVSFYRMVGLARLFPRSPRFGRYNMTYLDEDVETEVDSVVGAFMLVRAEAIRQVGLLDERFFMYGEDLDWAYRIKQAGWKVYYNPAVQVQHVKRAASRQSRQAQIAFYQAMRQFYYKHYRATTPLWLHWAILLGVQISLARTALLESLRPRVRSSPA